MSHFAEIDETGTVTRVLVCDNNMPNEGYDWLIETFGGTWVQTSYNNRIRKQFAGIGYTYDAVNDVFICPQPFPSWLLDGNFDWQPPVPQPVVEEGFVAVWDESQTNWEIIPIPEVGD